MNRKNSNKKNRMVKQRGGDDIGVQIGIGIGVFLVFIGAYILYRRLFPTPSYTDPFTLHGLAPGTRQQTK